MGKAVSSLISKLPFAYYPSVNKLEVALVVPKELRDASLPDHATVTVMPVQGGQPVVTGKIALDKTGQGQDLIDLPDLADGEYAVEYAFGDKKIRSPKTFKRIHYPWEKNQLGISHTVYPRATALGLMANSCACALGRRGYPGA